MHAPTFVWLRAATLVAAVVATTVIAPVAVSASASVFGACGSAFVALEWDGLRPDPADADGQSYRGDYVLREPLNVGGYTLGRVAVDTLAPNITVAATESTAYRQASVSWDVGTRTDVVRWVAQAMRVPVDTDASVNAAGMAPGGHLAARWDSVVYVTHPAGGWFVTDPVVFDPLGVVADANPPTLVCGAPVGGGIPPTACNVPGTLDGVSMDVVLVPEAPWVLLSPADYAAHVAVLPPASTVTVGVGTALLRVRTDTAVGGSLRRLSAHAAVPDGVVVLGGGGTGAVIQLGRTGWARVAAAQDAQVMYADSLPNALAMVVLVAAGVTWTVMQTSRLVTPPDASPLPSLALGTVVVATAFGIAVAEAVQWHVAPRSVLWMECETSVRGTNLGVTVLLGVTLAAVAVFAAAVVRVATVPSAHPLTPLAMRTGVIVAGTCGMVLAMVRAMGIEYSKRPSMVLVALPVVFTAIVSRAADAMVDPTPRGNRSAFASLPAAAGATLMYCLSAAFIVVLSVFTLRPVLVALTVPYTPAPWQQVVIVALALALAARVARGSVLVLTGVAHTKPT